MLLDDNLCDALAVTRQGENGQEPFYVKVNRDHTIQLCFLKSPFVRTQTDWFFFDGTAEVRTSLKCLPRIRTCVVRLEELYDAIPHDNEHLNDEEPLAPFFVWSAQSQVEELVILVGEFCKDIQPSQMKDLTSLQFDKFPKMDADKVSTMESDDFNPFVPRPDYNFFSELSCSNNYMITMISMHLARREYERRNVRERFLNSADGKQHLAKGGPTWWDDFSRWITTKEGDTWLSIDQGLSFLKSKTGHLWLASDRGSPWLETESGIRWLNTKDAKDFLDSDCALHWANTGAYEREDMPDLGRQVRKAWLDTPAGRGWEFDHCPNNNQPPKLPQLEMLTDAGPPFVNNYPRRAFHRNFNLRGWRFVMCPKESA
ncbi:hypothetical protein F4821DRAFT_243938 [Hypoxylon rubiginosum]|uniref:Uncharacterized protein n=1 Tax=Hypoxylon rubiginosum TaxID=110542 RepID=A0ACC0CU20_9PEZI|nr:hypothetical protein F4821DRAFT_243938 [Hypoxylon rubiginosum]